MTNLPPENPRSNVINLAERIKREIGEPQSAAAGDEPVPIDVGGHGPHPPGMDIGERLARLESAQEWTKIILGLIGPGLIGGFAFLGVQINRLDAKFDSLDGRIDSLGARISAEGAATRQIDRYRDSHLKFHYSRPTNSAADTARSHTDTGAATAHPEPAAS